jgi:microsomal epoxide hydrolase
MERQKAYAGSNPGQRHVRSLHPLYATSDRLNSLYWVTHTIERALYPYRQIRAANADLSPKGDKPFGYSFSPMEIVPRTGALVKHSCPNLEWYRDHTSGGHFWALEKPEEVAKDLADCFGQIWPREQ